uniref:Transmembrane protein n=1 Tax=Pithovirus LCPAC406 TaxID=2506599 RepID=A0A481ZGN1_9VIRU|nr:MAG: hypothetical protein LCPAC406_02940 [Pithovirus LCPAC406]
MNDVVIKMKTIHDLKTIEKLKEINAIDIDEEDSKQGERYFINPFIIILEWFGEKLSDLITILFLTILFAIPISATIIYIAFSEDLDECDVDFKTWLLSFIILTFITITGTLIEKKFGDDDKSPCAKCSGCIGLGLWIAACVLFAKSVKTGVCEEVSVHVYKYVLSIVFIVPAVAALIIVVAILVCFCICFYHCFCSDD